MIRYVALFLICYIEPSHIPKVFLTGVFVERRCNKGTKRKLLVAFVQLGDFSNRFFNPTLGANKS